MTTTPQDDLDQRVPDELPLLRALVDEWAGGGKPLEGVTAVLIQHQLGSIVPTVHALFELGLDPERTYFVDIPLVRPTARETAPGPSTGG